MKSFRTYSLLAGSLLTFALASCSNDELTSPSYDGPVAAQVTAGINGVLTRAADDAWEIDDAIGISCNSTNTNYDNMKYVTTGGDGTFTHDGGVASGIFFQGTEAVNFSAYYPFSGTEGSAAGSIDNVTTNDQTQQKKFDYLYATGATTTYASPTISFKNAAIFKHKMSRLILKITTSTTDGFNAEDVKKGTYSISGISHSGTFNTMTGTAEATDGSAINDWVISAAPQDENNQRTYSMILYPQSKPTLKFKVEIDGQTYATDITPTLTASTSNTYTITVKKTGLVVSSNTIEGWGSEQTGNSDATIQ